jgi:trigger factor
LEITLDKHSTNEALIKIKLNEADYQSKVEIKLKDYAKKAVIRGFRPGKAPVSMVKSIYGTSILIEEINDLLSESLNSYINEQTIQILGHPVPVDSGEEKIDWKKQKEFEFEYKIGFVEPFQLDLDKTVSLTKYSILVDEELVNETIENLKFQHGESFSPDVCEAGDFIYGDLASSDSVIKQDILIDTSKLTEKLAGKFIGISKEAVFEFDDLGLKKEDWSEVLDLNEGEINDLTGPFTFTVTEISRSIPTELNQEFFDKVFGPSVASTEEEFKDKVKEALGNSYRRSSKAFTEDELKKLLIEKANISIPENFYKDWLIRINKDKITETEIERDFPIYAEELIWSLISGQIAKDNNISADYEEVVNKTKQMIRQQFASSGLGNQLEASMDIFVDNYLRGHEGQNYSKMAGSVIDEKVFAWVLETINLTEKIVSPDEFKELLRK